MNAITTSQARNRYTVLSPTLREALFSEQTAEIISSVSSQYNIPEEKSGDIAECVGWVLLGFIHPEDLPVEIVARTGIAQQAAKDISGSLANKVFNALKPELDKAYAPLPHEQEAITPKIIQEIKPPQKMTAPLAPKPPVAAAPAPMPLSDVISQTAAGAMSVGASPLASNRNNAGPAPTPAAPKAKSDEGWSKSSAQEPVVKLGVISPGVPSPSSSQSSSPAPRPITAPPLTSGPKTMGEFERLSAMKRAPEAKPMSPTPGAPAGSATAAPFMLHENPTVAPGQKTPDFHLQQTTMQNQMTTGAIPRPVKPAVLELGGTPKPAADALAPKVVHYSEYKTTISPPASASPSTSAPTAGTGPRNITEMTSAAPAAVPPPTSKPPLPPQTPMPPRVINKDFLDPNKP